MNTEALMSTTDRLWQEELYDVLKEFGVTHIAHVPDGGHRLLIDRALVAPEVKAIPLTTGRPCSGIPERCASPARRP